MSQVMVQRDEFVASAKHIRELARQAVNVRTADAFEILETRISAFDKVLRQSLQTWSLADVELIAEKLDDGGFLMPREIEILREVVVGDTAQNVAPERNIEEWMEVLTTLAERIGEHADQDGSDAVAQARSVVQDALRLLPPLRQYASERERLERFDNAVSDLSPTARRVLAESLRVRLEQPEA